MKNGRQKMSGWAGDKSTIDGGFFKRLM